MAETTENEAFFAGRIFVHGEQNSYRFLMWGTHSMPTDNEGGMSFSTTIAEPAEGAFLCKLETGWLLVMGAGERSPVRHTFLDASLEAEENAASVVSLGVPALTIEEGNDRVRKDGVMLYSITGDEKQRAAATARYEAWQDERADKNGKTGSKK